MINNNNFDIFRYWLCTIFGKIDEFMKSNNYSRKYVKLALVLDIALF